MATTTYNTSATGSTVYQEGTNDVGGVSQTLVEALRGCDIMHVGQDCLLSLAIILVLMRYCSHC